MNVDNLITTAFLVYFLEGNKMRLANLSASGLFVYWKTRFADNTSICYSNKINLLLSC